jgi:mono/diheme cytochrome c family protein
MKIFMPLLLVVASGAGADHALDQHDLAKGRALYRETCAACHGADLRGQPDWRTANADGVLPAPPHDRTGHTWHHDNALLFDYTKLGGRGALASRGITDFNSGMPAFGTLLSDDDIWTVLAYIKSTWPEREHDIQASRNAPQTNTGQP